jgi:low affinity Fe/Cu permease
MPRKARNRSRKALSRKSSMQRQPQLNRASHQGYFERFAWAVAHLAGRPAAFLIALGMVIAWAISGPVFGFSDTWQLFINSSTTIMTFLMVFLIQNTQNRDTTALQVKLDALIFASRGAKDRIAAAEHLSDQDLEQLHDQYTKHAELALDELRKRRPSRTNGKHNAA